MLKKSYPYFILDGNASEAIEFYATVFNAKVEDITYFRDMPEDPEFSIPEEAKNLVMHGSIELPNGEIYMFSDNMPGSPFVTGIQLSTAIVFDNVEESRQVFNNLGEGGKIEMELQETFWSPLYGYVVDKYGNQWQVDTELEDA